MDASSHKLHTVGSADSIADVPQSVRANAANAEATAVIERLLGLRLSQIRHRDTVTQRIEERIFSIIDENRSSISRADLRAALDANLNNALQQINPQLDYDAANQRDRIQAVAQAVYESVPSDLIYQLGIMSAPVNVAVNGGQSTSIVEISRLIIRGAAHDVQIDTNHPFWRLNTFRDSSDIQQAMQGLTGRDIGIVNANLKNHLLDPREITRLATSQFNIVSVPSVNIADTNTLVVQAGSVTTNTNFTVKMNSLLRAMTNDDAPPRLQNCNIAELNPAQIRTLMLYRGQAGDFPYWKKFVTCGTNNPTDVVNVCTQTPTYVHRTLADVVGDEIFAARGGVITAPIGTRNVRLLDVHTDVRAEQAKLQTLMEKLTTGSENPGGAALALSLAASNKAVMNSVTQQTEETKLQTELNKARARQELSIRLKKLSDLDINFRIPTMPLRGPASFATIAAERAHLNSDIGALGTTASWTSEYCRNAGFPAPSTFTTPAERRDMTARLQQQLKEVTEELTLYEQLENMLKRVVQPAVTSEVFASSPRLSGLINAAGVVIPGAITADINTVALADAIRTETRLQSDADIEAEIKKNEGLLKQSKSGGENGDALQQRIFEQHFQRQGLSATEAKKSANYLYTRSLLDEQMVGQHQALLDDMFGGVHHVQDNKNEATGRKSLRYAALTLDIPSRDIVTGTTTRSFGAGFMGTSRQTVNITETRYDWDNVPYQKLVTAYFSFKKMYEGNAPQNLNAVGSHAIQDEMRRIAEILARRHTHMILHDLGNNLSDEDRRKLGSRKLLSVETLEQYLTGEAPEKYRPRIDEVLHVTESRRSRERDVVGSLTKVTRAALGKVTNFAASGGSKTVNALNAARKWTWGQKKNIAIFTLFTALCGPLGSLAFAGMKGMESGPSATAAPAQH